MSGIVFDSFDFGLDLRRGASTSPPNRLRDLVNCYITTGKEIKKRPGLELVATLEAGTKGLRSGLGKLNTFYESGTITHANTLFKPRRVPHTTPGSTDVSKAWYCDAFNGYLYLAIEYANGDVKHHYVNGTANSVVWTTNTYLAAGAVVRPTVDNDRYYSLTVEGCAPTAEPTWPTTVGNTLTPADTDYALVNAGNQFGTKYALGAVCRKSTIANLVHEFIVAGPVGNTFTPTGTVGVEYTVDPSTFNVWVTLMALALGAHIRPTVANGFIYEVMVAGTGAAGEPTWPTVIGNTVVSGTITYACRAPAKTICRSKPTYTCIYPITSISDANCPHGKGVTKSASKIWSTKAAAPYDVVRYSKTDDCTNWTAAGDAGFLPVGLKQENAQDCRALGQFQNKLVCFFQDSTQLWTVDTNPANNALSQRIFGVGTRYPQSPASFADDVFFLADQGVRSITVNQQTANLQDSDIGSPIDSVVAKAISGTTPLGIYIPPFGQFWLMMGSVAWVYTFSKNAKLAAWAKYTFPFTIDDIAILDNIVYVRNNDKVYKFSEDKGSDDGSPIQCRVQFPYLDFKKPGILKQITAMDAVLEGSWAIQFLIDGNDQGASTDPFIVTGDTRPLPSIPVELCVPAIAPVLQHSSNEPAKITALSFTFYDLGAM